MLNRAKSCQVDPRRCEISQSEMRCNHLAYLFSNRGVKDSFNRKLTTIVLKRNKASQGEQLCFDESQCEPNFLHLANLLSYRDVKEGFDRKPTTKEQNEVDLQGYTWRYAEKKGFDMSEITTK